MLPGISVRDALANVSLYRLDVRVLCNRAREIFFCKPQKRKKERKKDLSNLARCVRISLLENEGELIYNYVFNARTNVTLFSYYLYRINTII